MIVNINNYHPINILTDRGIVELKDILPGDKVFEYKTGNLLKVIGISEPSRSLINKITYSDRRVEYIRSCDDLYTGKDIIPMLIVPKNQEFHDIKQYPVKFDHAVHNTLDPNPYIAGMFLMYGDYHDRFINLPSNMTGFNNINGFRYAVNNNLTPIKYNDKVYFKYADNSKNLRITWKQFFKDIDIYATTKDVREGTIPDEYVMTSAKDRIQFVKGIFDIGYAPNLFDDKVVGIVNKSNRKLKALQELLWSLGILSKIEYEPAIDAEHESMYKLSIIGDYDGYPGFTNMLSSIEELIDRDNKIITFTPPFKTKIANISQIDCKGNYSTSGIMGNLILEKPKALYLTSNFVPRVSV